MDAKLGQAIAQRFCSITKERTEGGLNKGAHLLPLYSSHFWFFRIEQYRGQYGVSIFPSSVN
jgi:hypothetical protein